MIVLHRNVFDTGMVRRWDNKFLLLEIRKEDVWVMNYATAAMDHLSNKRATRNGASLRLRADKQPLT